MLICNTTIILAQKLLNMDVLALTPSQTKQAIDVLTNSFMDDPNFIAIYPDRDQRHKILPMIFEDCLKDGLAYGKVLAAKEQEEILGVAVWFPPCTLPMKPYQKIKLGLSFLPILLAAPAPTLNMISFTEHLFKFHPSKPFWYLEASGVRHGHQGKGIGSALVAAVTKLADQAHTPCYLETMNTRNIPLYEKHGFSVTRSHVSITKAGAPAWFMWREPVE